MELSGNNQPPEIEDFEQTFDDIVCFIDFLKKVQVDEIKWAFNELNRGGLMTKIIQV